jgi:hypothetical protein
MLSDKKIKVYKKVVKNLDMTTQQRLELSYYILDELVAELFGTNKSIPKMVEIIDELELML